jgi:alkylhydroperoxidase family enzyme
VRFDSARAAGLQEEQVERIVDGYQQTFGPREVAALTLTDALIGDPTSLRDEDIAALRSQFSDPEIVEIALGVGLFLGMSKVLINLGLEPEHMPVTILSAPGSA